jgi:hypothetical protein
MADVEFSLLAWPPSLNKLQKLEFNDNIIFGILAREMSKSYLPQPEWKQNQRISTVEDLQNLKNLKNLDLFDCEI